jgi:hypothetical protein
MMNVYNPTIQIAVGGLRIGKNAAWFGLPIAPIAIPATEEPFTLPLEDDGQTITTPQLISVLADGITFNAPLFLQLLAWAQISDPTSSKKFLGVRFDADPPATMRSQAAFVQGVAQYLYNGLVATGDTLRFTASTDQSGTNLLAGNFSFRVDAYV